MLKLLIQLVETPSIYPQEKRVSDYIYELLKKEPGIAVQKHYIDKTHGRYNILAQNNISKKGTKSILLYAHLDTVPVARDWKKNPFKLTIQGDRAYGLGAYDMKAGAALIIELFKAHKNIPLKLILGVDEENISEGMHGLKGHAFMKNITFALVPEPDFSQGTGAICLGRRGRVIIEATFKGDGNHIFLAQQSTNAIRHALVFDREVSKLKLRINKHFGENIITPRKITGEAIGMSVPGTATIEYDVLHTPPETSESILKEFKRIAIELHLKSTIKYLPEVCIKERKTPYLEPFEIDTKSDVYKKVKNAIESVLPAGINPTIYYRNSVGDENVLATIHHIPVFTIGPEGDNAHRTDEWVSLDSMYKTYKIYKKIIDMLNE